MQVKEAMELFQASGASFQWSIPKGFEPWWQEFLGNNTKHTHFIVTPQMGGGSWMGCVLWLREAMFTYLAFPMCIYAINYFDGSKKHRMLWSWQVKHKQSIANSKPQRYIHLGQLKHFMMKMIWMQSHSASQGKAELCRRIQTEAAWGKLSKKHMCPGT